MKALYRKPISSINKKVFSCSLTGYLPSQITSMPRRSQLISISVEEELLELLNDQKSRNKAIAAVNQDLVQQMQSLTRWNETLQRKNKSLEKKKEMLEEGIEYWRKRMIFMENRLERIEDDRDAVTEGFGGVDNGRVAREKWNGQENSVESLLAQKKLLISELEAANEWIENLEERLERRNLLIDELEEKVDQLRAADGSDKLSGDEESLVDAGSSADAR